MYSRKELTADFRHLGVVPGDVIMLHASVRSVGEVVGGPDEIHLALKDALTPSGTLMMYASCPRYVDEVGRGNLTAAEEREVLEHLPAFDAQTARSARDNGALVELFRTYPGSRVNDHPARFVSWGRHTDHLFAEQPWDYAFGRGSALERFVALGGKILLLGCDHDTVTFLHYAEHIVDIADKRIARFRVPVLENGTRVWKEMAEVDSSGNGAHPSWPPDMFRRIVDSHLRKERNMGRRVGESEAYLIPAQGLLAYALDVMRRQAADPSTCSNL